MQKLKQIIRKKFQWDFKKRKKQNKIKQKEIEWPNGLSDSGHVKNQAIRTYVNCTKVYKKVAEKMLEEFTF